jgi:integrase/recombinase XerD
MTPLRQQMIAALQLSGKGERTQQAYVREVRLLSQCYGKSPDLISEQELQAYFLPRKNVDRLAPASMRLCYIHLTQKGHEDAYQRLNSLMQGLAS